MLDSWIQKGQKQGHKNNLVISLFSNTLDTIHLVFAFFRELLE